MEQQIFSSWGSAGGQANSMALGPVVSSQASSKVADYHGHQVLPEAKSGHLCLKVSQKCSHCERCSPHIY